MTNLMKIYSGLPGWARAVVVIAIIILVIWLIYLINKWVKKLARDKNFKSDYDDLIAQGQEPSYLQTVYTNLADRIESAASGFAFGFGTDEEAIFGVFEQMNNDLDVLLLSKAFGARTAPDCYINCPSLSLGAFLTNELSGENIAEINTILSSKGITSVF